MKPIFLALGLLSFLCTVAYAAPTPAVTAVQQFIDARKSQNYAATHALLSHDTKQVLPFNQFIAPNNFTYMLQGVPSTFAVVVALFADTHNASGYSFTVVGTASSSSNIVLVRAVLPKDPQKAPQMLKVAVITDPADGGRLRLDIIQSLKAADPVAFEKARQTAQRASSMSNLKQLALGVIQYAQDHDAHLPNAAKWVDELLPYVRSEAIFHDPSAPASQKWSYAYNRNLSGKSLALFDAPAETVMLFESTLGVKNASDTGQSVPVPGRHTGGTDYALADGHVKWFADGTKLSYLLSGK